MLKVNNMCEYMWRAVELTNAYKERAAGLITTEEYIVKCDAYLLAFIDYFNLEHSPKDSAKLETPDDSDIEGR